MPPSTYTPRSLADWTGWTEPWPTCTSPLGRLTWFPSLTNYAPPPADYVTGSQRQHCVFILSVHAVVRPDVCPVPTSARRAALASTLTVGLATMAVSQHTVRTSESIPVPTGNRQQVRECIVCKMNQSTEQTSPLYRNCCGGIN